MKENILITGGAGGIGSAVSKRFLSEGYEVFSIDLCSLDLGEHFHNLVGDVTSLDSLNKIKEQLSGVSFSHIITLAGRALPDEWKEVKDIPLQTIHDSINVNLVGQLNVIRLFLDKLSGKNKSILLISSINAFGGFGLPYYSAAKAGLIGYVNTVKDELKKNGIRINVVAPGTVQTEATLKEPKDFSALLKLTDNGRFATVEEVANLSFDICAISDKTGVVEIIDNGQLKNNKHGN